jgi:uncharacterized protein (DUF2384 family)
MATAARLKTQAMPRQQDFSAAADRKRLSQVAIKAFVRLAASWKLNGQEAAALLGVSTSTWERMKAAPAGKELTQDQMTRISALVGIYKALHLMFAGGIADEWPRLANKGPLFEGRTPLAAMLEGGIPMMLDVRRLVDAVRGGI